MCEQRHVCVSSCMWMCSHTHTHTRTKATGLLSGFCSCNGDRDSVFIYLSPSCHCCVWSRSLNSGLWDTWRTVKSTNPPNYAECYSPETHPGCLLWKKQKLRGLFKQCATFIWLSYLYIFCTVKIRTAVWLFMITILCLLFQRTWKRVIVDFFLTSLVFFCLKTSDSERERKLVDILSCKPWRIRQLLLSYQELKICFISLRNNVHWVREGVKILYYITFTIWHKKYGCIVSKMYLKISKVR